MKKLVLVIVLILGILFSSNAQSLKTTETLNQVWMAYFHQSRISDKFGLWADFQLRTNSGFVNKFSRRIVRVGVSYFVNDAIMITAGYAQSTVYFPATPKKVSQPEHRPWQQFQWQTAYGKSRMQQRFRLEERFKRKYLNDSTLGDESNFNFRARYGINYEIPFGIKGFVAANKLALLLSEEINVNFGKGIVNNMFDQNRIMVGLKYNINKHNNLQVGYMNQFQQTAAGNKYKNYNIIRLSYFQNLDLRRHRTKE